MYSLWDWLEKARILAAVCTYVSLTLQKLLWLALETLLRIGSGEVETMLQGTPKWQNNSSIRIGNLQHLFL